MPLTLIDIGVNLDHASFSKDRREVISRAVKAGVVQMVATGTHLRSSQGAQALSKENPGVVFSTAGFHPHNAKLFDDRAQKALKELLQKPEVVSVGECGLDFNRDFSPRPVQEKCFEAQLALAKELQKPLFLHERDAFERFSAILQNNQQGLPPAVVHCFTGDAKELEAYLAMGLYIGITGWICDERRGTHLKSLLPKIPLDRLMVETDAPFLTPRDLRPKPADNRNEPSFLPHVTQAIAKALKKSPQEVADATTQNARSFFRLPPHPGA